MKLDVPCPHCEHIFSENTRGSTETTCDWCGRPVVVFPRGTQWLSAPADWGRVGDPEVFRQVVCSMLDARLGAVNDGPDCFAGCHRGLCFDHVEVKCHGRPVPPYLVDGTFEKYGHLSLAMVAGEPGYGPGAIDAALVHGIALYCVLLGPRGYALKRVA